jgi:uncharacterized alkaline shock family protein YloU
MAAEVTSQGPPVVQQELGTLEVEDRVFRDIFRRIVSQTPGIARLRRAPTGAFRRRSADAVRVERGQGEVAFSVSAVVRYDVAIPQMVAELREKVVQAVEESTGYHVRAVNVAIDRILPPVPGPMADEVPGMPPLPGSRAARARAKQTDS